MTKFLSVDIPPNTDSKDGEDADKDQEETIETVKSKSASAIHDLMTASRTGGDDEWANSCIPLAAVVAHQCIVSDEWLVCL